MFLLITNPVLGELVKSASISRVRLGALAASALVSWSSIAVATPHAAAAATGPAVPFGSHSQAYVAGTLRPTGSQATLDAAVVTLYNKWKSKFLVSACGNGLAVKADANVPFVAEGQGYGLELTALMAGADAGAQTSFDGILKFVLAHPSSINPGLHAAEQNATCQSVNGSDSATDGDLSIAYGLLLADRQWGSGGTYDYKQLALSRINAIKASEMNQTTKLPLLGDWSSPGDSYYNATRPSDLMIDHFRAFKSATNDPFWDSAVAAAQGLISQQQATFSPSTGLIADFVVSTNTSAKPAPPNFLEAATDGQYSYNSVRVPWHIGTDAALTGDAASKSQTQKITTWIRAKTGNNPGNVRAGYKLDGTATVNYLDPEFVATLGPAAMMDSANQSWLDKVWNYTAAAANTTVADAYYSASLMLHSMIVMSGNYWTPVGATASTPPPTPTPTPTPTPSGTSSPTPTTSAAGCAAFVQPYAGMPAYQKGDKVTFNGKGYVSTFGPNWWSPSAAPQYWAETTCGGAAPTPTPAPTATGTPAPTPTPTTNGTVPTPVPLPAGFRVAPYVDFSNWPMPDMLAAKAATGVSNYNLGFITTSGACAPAWGGFAALSPTTTGFQIDALNKQIADLQATGGTVAVSFGGQAGTELAQSCSDVASLKAAYKTVIDRYNLTRIDFDIEGSAQGDHSANIRRGQAIAALQKDAAAAGKALTVTFTVPVMPTGLTQEGLGVLQDTAYAGARIDLVNVMAMDYGPPSSTMGQNAIDAATSTAAQISFLYPGSTTADRIHRVGITPMIGENDFVGETFTLADAQKVAAWAKTNNVGEIAWWALQRDTPCANNATLVSENCSGTSNPTWAYTNAFNS